MTPGEIVQLWKEEIESINIRGYTRKIESTNCFQMNQYYTGHPHLTDCYKVNFNFEDGITSYNPCNEIMLQSGEIKKMKDDWHHELERLFTQKFGTPIESISDEVRFENEICDYMTNQGYRFIIQFYVPGYLSKRREEKIKKLLKT